MTVSPAGGDREISLDLSPNTTTFSLPTHWKNQPWSEMAMTHMWLYKLWIAGMAGGAGRNLLYLPDMICGSCVQSQVWLLTGSICCGAALTKWTRIISIEMRDRVDCAADSLLFHNTKLRTKLWWQRHLIGRHKESSMRKHSHWLTQDFVVCYWRRSEIVAPIKSKVDQWIQSIAGTSLYRDSPKIGIVIGGDCRDSSDLID